jgi:WD40 repeat protein
MSSSTAQKTSVITPSQKFEGHTRFIDNIVHLPDGQRIITCSSDGSLRAWNLKSGKQIGADWRREEEDEDVWSIALSPDCVSFSADGKLLATGSEDTNAYTWDVYAILKEAGLDDLLLDVNVS